MGMESWTSHLPVGQQALPVRFVLRSLKVVVKTEDTIQLAKLAAFRSPKKTHQATGHPGGKLQAHCSANRLSCYDLIASIP